MKKNPKAYCIGGGIASLASAAYLIRDGGMPGKNITILEQDNVMGGCLDAKRLSSGRGYALRGYRMFEGKVYEGMLDLLSFIPSLNDHGASVRDEFAAFNAKYHAYAKSRIVVHGEAINARKMGLSTRDKLDLLKLLIRPESTLGTLRISDAFSPSFFSTNIWIEFCTIFAFQPWHSLAEFRRYMLRFIHDVPVFDTVETLQSTPYNQYESVVLPLVDWLHGQKVNFLTGSRVTDLDFARQEDTKTVECIRYLHEGKPDAISIEKDDLVFVTLGSLASDARFGSMTEPPTPAAIQRSTAWELWENLAKDHPDFGKPSVFNSAIDESTFAMFTMTFHAPVFIDLMKKYCGNDPSIYSGMTIKDSAWLISMILPHQPHFMHQLPDENVYFGYGLHQEEKGDFVHKKLTECTGEEILTELCEHLNFTEQLPEILSSATCIPCILPYAASQFLPRAPGDRPKVIPDGSTNLALIGQYCEIPDDIVFTVDYSVRSAQMAVYSLLKLTKKVTPIYKGQHSLKVLWSAMKAILR